MAATILSEINALVKGLDIEDIHRAWSVLTSLVTGLKGVLEWLRKVEKTNVSREIRTVTRGLKYIYWGLLTQCKQLQNCSDQCHSMLGCLESEILTQHMDIYLYLWQHRLEEYKPLFDVMDIAYVADIVDLGITHELEMHFKEPMRRDKYWELMKMIEKAEHNRTYINHCMETDLKQVEDKCKESATIVRLQLKESLDETQEITQKVVRNLEEERSKNESVGLGFKLLTAAGIIAISGGLAVFSIPGFVVAGMGGIGYSAGIVGSCKVKAEDDKIVSQLRTVQSITGYWETVLRSSMLKWEYLIEKIKEVVKLLLEGRCKLKEQELHDLNSHIHETQKSLRIFQQGAENFKCQLECILRI